jgi:hypothetical protein
MSEAEVSADEDLFGENDEQVSAVGGQGLGATDVLDGIEWFL